MRTIRAIVRPHTIIKWNVKRTLFIMENLKQIKKSNDINMPQISPKLKLLKTYNFFVRVHNCVVFSQSSRQLIRQHSLVGSKLSLLNNLNHQHEYDQPEEPSCQNAPAQSVQIHVWNTNAQEHGYSFYKIKFLLLWIEFIKVIRFIKKSTCKQEGQQAGSPMNDYERFSATTLWFRTNYSDKHLYFIQNSKFRCFYELI